MKNYFSFDALHTTYRKESIAGVTTFLSMAYILFVNPMILSDAGMDEGAVFTATALAAALGTLIMGILAKYPIALAPGMGLNAFFSYTVVLGLGIDWQIALFGVFMSGIVFMAITLFGIREKVINAIPAQLKYAVGAGIGLFIAFIGLQNAGIVVADESTVVSLGSITEPTVLLACFGLVITVILMVLKVYGGIFFGMILTSIAGMVTGLIALPSAVVSSAPSLSPTFGAAFTELGSLDWTTAVIVQLIIVILTFCLSIFSTRPELCMLLPTRQVSLKITSCPCRQGTYGRFFRYVDWSHSGYVNDYSLH